MQLIASGRLHEFYNSPEWERVRRRVLRKNKRRCYDCERKAPAIVTRANTVHHVNELRARPDLALSEVDEEGRPNLVCLCASCHYQRHHNIKIPITPERW